MAGPSTPRHALRGFALAMLRCNLQMLHLNLNAPQHIEPPPTRSSPGLNVAPDRAGRKNHALLPHEEQSGRSFVCSRFATRKRNSRTCRLFLGQFRRWPANLLAQCPLESPCRR
jgi:hypothetical protein